MPWFMMMTPNLDDNDESVPACCGRLKMRMIINNHEYDDDYDDDNKDL